MEIIFENSQSLLDFAQKKVLLNKLIKQIEKDFILANAHLEINENTDAIQLNSVIREKVYYLLMEHFSDYLNLLYIIDVPEKDFKNIKLTDAVEIADQVSFLILKREMQKVWFKAKYSS